MEIPKETCDKILCMLALEEKLQGKYIIDKEVFVLSHKINELKKSDAACYLCQDKVSKSDMAICGNCFASFHKAHLLEWMVKFKECPVCVYKVAEHENN